MSGDTNPVHLDEEYAKGTQFGGRIAHGMLSGALISAAVASTMPGPGSIYIWQLLRKRGLTEAVKLQLPVSPHLLLFGLRHYKSKLTFCN